MKTVQTFNGKNIDLKAYQDSLRNNFPAFCRKDISDNGTPFLHNCVQTENECGCTIVGNGTIQFPLTINFCNKHK